MPELLTEIPGRFFIVSYYATTPKGSYSLFNLRGNVDQMMKGAKSETAVAAYLRTRHPGCEIAIQNLEWKDY